MPPATTIRSLAVTPLDVPLHAPFGISGGAQSIAHNLLVTLELADGTRGYGEAAPFPAFNGETQSGAAAAIESVRSIVEGADVRAWRASAGLLRERIGAFGSARCAIETAMLDALTRHARMPLFAFFGGAATVLETDMTIGTGTIEIAAPAARAILARGITTIKIKIGAGDLQHDLDRITAIHAVAPASPLILDGNGGMHADAALELIHALRARAIHPVLLEQPVPAGDWAGMCRLTAEAGVPVAADESASSAANVLRIAQEHAAHVVNIKLMKTGVVEALDMAAICRATGLRLMIGSLIETVLGTSMSLHVAAGLGGFVHVDLDMPMFQSQNPFTGGYIQQGARLDIANTPSGHGVSPRRPSLPSSS